MNSDDIVKWIELQHPFSAAFIVALGAFFLIRRTTTVRVYWLYLLAPIIVLAVSWEYGRPIYFFVFCLGMLTAFAEIINKFPDEPIKALGSGEALIYHVANGIVAIVALLILVYSGVPSHSPIDQLKIGTLAGLGSMLVMRSKLFNIKVAGEDVSFGPEQVVKLFFSYMEEAIDRIRSRARIEFVTENLQNVDFDKAYPYTITMLHSAQTWSEEEWKEVNEQIASIKTDQEALDGQLKSYRLGFLLLNKMGEDFVSTLFEAQRPEWSLRAPLKPVTFIDRLFGDDCEEPYFSYGPNMAVTVFLSRLGYPSDDPGAFERLVRPSRGVLKGFRVVFNKPSTNSVGFSEINIEADPEGQVEGVIYHLNRKALEYLNRSEPGYSLQVVNVITADGKATIRCQAFAYDGKRTDEKPESGHALSVIRGATARGLSHDYIEFLRKAAGLQTASAGA